MTLKKVMNFKKFLFLNEIIAPSNVLNTPTNWTRLPGFSKNLTKSNQYLHKLLCCTRCYILYHGMAESWELIFCVMMDGCSRPWFLICFWQLETLRLRDWLNTLGAHAGVIKDIGPLLDSGSDMIWYEEYLCW